MHFFIDNSHTSFHTERAGHKTHCHWNWLDPGWELEIVGKNQYFEILEARVGIEPTHKGFADLSLTTWVPRLNP